MTKKEERKQMRAETNHVDLKGCDQRDICQDLRREQVELASFDSQDQRIKSLPQQDQLSTCARQEQESLPHVPPLHRESSLPLTGNTQEVITTIFTLHKTSSLPAALPNEEAFVNRFSQPQTYGTSPKKHLLFKQLSTKCLNREGHSLIGPLCTCKEFTHHTEFETKTVRQLSLPSARSKADVHQFPFLENRRNSFAIIFVLKIYQTLHSV